jgi:hypothetical protein
LILVGVSVFPVHLCPLAPNLAASRRPNIVWRL